MSFFVGNLESNNFKSTLILRGLYSFKPLFFKQNFVNTAMLTIVSASNRKENQTTLFAKACERYLREKKEEVSFFGLDQIPSEAGFHEIYNYGNSSFTAIAEKYVQHADKFIFVIPEYNGSYPGVLKLFIDAILPQDFKGKKACLIGVASGHAGNIRGVDHFCDVMNYLDVNVMPKKLTIPRIDSFIEDQKIQDEAIISKIEDQIDKFLAF